MMNTILFLFSVFGAINRLSVGRIFVAYLRVKFTLLYRVTFIFDFFDLINSADLLNFEILSLRNA